MRRRRKLRSRVVAVVDEGAWLMRMTGRSPTWWVACVQRAIQKASRPGRDPRHDETDVLRWLRAVVLEVARVMPTEWRYDGNMRMAAVLAHILALWYVRVQRAKCYDPRRPVALRQEAFAGWIEYAMALVKVVLDEREDAAMFPTQDWESPFAPGATDGSFV